MNYRNSINIPENGENEENQSDDEKSSHLILSNLSTSESLKNLRNERIRKIKNKIIIYEKDNEWYEGEIDKYYTRQGYGIYYYNSGDVYEGEFQEGLRSGFGDYIFQDGARFTGEWMMDKKNGFGSYKYKNFDFNGQWENDNFISGFAFKINSDEKESSLLEEDSESYSSRGYSYCTSLMSSPKNRTRKNSINKEEKENVKFFIDRVDKKLQNLNKISPSIDVDLLNFKSNVGDVSLIKSFIKNENTKRSVHTQNNSIINFEVTPINSKSVSKVNSRNNSEINVNKLITKSNPINLQPILYKDMEYKCKYCLMIKNGLNISGMKCNCKDFHIYIKNRISNE